jgi:RNase P/RNase MRP subunit p30
MQIVFPEKNEEKFVEMAARLGIDELVFVYNLKEFVRKEFDGEVKIKFGILAKSSEIQKAKNKADLVLYECDEDARHVIEKFKPDIIFNFENSSRKDFIHHRNSGMNHIIAKLMCDKGVKLGVSFANLLESGKRDVLIGRIKQNLRLCKKYKVDVIVSSFAKDVYRLRCEKEMIGVLIY